MKRKIIFLSIIYIFGLLITSIIFSNMNISVLEIGKEINSKFSSSTNEEILGKECNLSASGHRFVNYISNNDATCYKDGTKTAICNNGCGARDTIVDEGKKLPHTYGEWSMTKEATCAEPGELQRTCKVQKCGYIEKRPIVVLVHSYSKEWTIDKQPTCTEEGSKSHHCTRENCTAKKDETAIPVISHVFGEWIIDKEATYEEEGHKYRTCINCNTEKEEQVIQKLNKDELQVKITYDVKEKDNQKYAVMSSAKDAQEILKNITSNKELEIIDKSGEIIGNTDKVGTGSKVVVKETKEVAYTIVVKGDINGDTKVDFINDIIGLNNYRLNIVNLDTESALAGDVNGDGKVDFINDIISINNYRIGLVNSL